MDYIEGERYPLTPEDFQKLISATGTSLTLMLTGKADYARGRRYVKAPGDWEFWNEKGNKISAHLSNTAQGPVVIVSVSKEIDADRPDEL